MNRFIGAVCGLLLLLAGLPAQAQNTGAPSVTVMQAGADRLMEDLEYLVSLGTPQEQKQWANLKGFFDDIYFPGIDRKKPIRVDILLDQAAARYRSSFPLASLRDFRNNLDAFGISSRKRSASLYQLTGEGFPTSWLRFRHGYAIISQEKNDVPLNIPDPELAIAGLLKAGYDTALDLSNAPKKIDARRKDFQSVRKDWLAKIQQNPDESREEFELRKLAAEQQIEELERYYAESEHVTLGWTTDGKQKEGRLEIALDPIAGTSLAKAVDLLNQAPNHFANIPQATDSILGLRVNSPLGEMRRNHMAEFVKKSRAAAHRRLDDADRTDEQKAAAKQAVDGIFDMVLAGAEKGLLELAVEVGTKPAGTHTLVGGIRTADGNAIHPIVEMLPKTRDGRTVELDIAKVGETRIHKVGMQPDQEQVLKAFFGEDLSLYVGGDEKAVWVGIGTDALQDLKAAIEAVGKENTGDKNDPFVDLSIRISPWLELRSKLSPIVPPANQPPQAGEKKNEAGTGPAGQLQPRIDRSELRNLALEAMAAGDDRLTMQLRREDDSITGKMNVQPGILRIIGKGLAKFSKENLAD